MVDNLLEWLQVQFAHFQSKAWVVEVFTIVLVTIFLAALVKFFFKRIMPHVLRTRTVWDDSVAYALERPLFYLVWLLGLTIAADIVSYSGKNVAIFQVVEPIRRLGIIIFFAWVLVRLVDSIEDNYLKGKAKTADKIDQTTVHALSKIFRGAVVITAILVALQTFGIGISGVLAAGGIGGAAIAFSAKDLLANYFGGLIIYLDRPFAVGDWIRSPDKSIEGVVEHIGWRLCCIRTFDKRPLYVPNTVFTTISIENPSRMSNRRIKTKIGLRYQDGPKVATILAEIKAMLRSHPEIDTSQTLLVCLTGFGPSSLDFLVYTFTLTTDWVRYQGIQQDVFLKILEIIYSHGAECSMHTAEIHVPEAIQFTQVPAELENILPQG